MCTSNKGGEKSMATIINNPERRNSSGMGFLLGVIVFIIFLVLVLYYGLPALQNMGGTQINVPKQVDVNVNTQSK